MKHHVIADLSTNNTDMEVVETNEGKEATVPLNVGLAWS
jgi:hypothetical protein